MTVKNAEAYVVLHTRVGVHRAGDVITFPAKLLEDMGENGIDRLLRIGALRKADSDETKQAKVYGDTDEYQLQTVPDATLTTVVGMHTEAATDAPVPAGEDPATVASAKEDAPKPAKA